MKYGKYTGGQIEAVLNMIGGEEAIDRLLAGKVRIELVPVVRVQPEPTEEMVVCGVFSGCRCTICGSFFGDSAYDTVCQQGHEIGKSYPKSKAA